MPLPLKEPIALRGAKLTDGGPVAIALTMTQKQVEAMFKRKDELKGSQSPLEIDFDSKKLIIGDLVASFTTAAEESTYREMCRRLPTGLDPLKPLTTWGSYVGRLNLQRNDQEIASNIKRKTLAENLKRDEHKTVFLDTPPSIPTPSVTKKGKQSASLVKRAISKSQANARPAVKDGTPSSRSVSTATAQAPATSGTSNSASQTSNSTFISLEALRELPKIDLDTARSRAIHGLGAFKDHNDKDGMTAIEFRSLLSKIRNRIVEERPSTQLLREIGEPMPKDPLKWQLKVNTWREVRPDDAPSLADEERQNLRRKGRIALNPPQGSPFFSLFQLKSEKVESSKKDDELYRMSKPSKSVAGTIPKAKVPAREKGTKLSNGTGDIPPKKATTTAAIKGKGRVDSNAAATSPVSTSALSKREETKIASSSIKSRPLTVESVKKEPSPLSRPSLSREDINIRKRASTAILDDDGSDMEEGELPANGTKRRKISKIADTSRLDAFATNNGSSTVKDRTRPLIKEEEGAKRSRKEPAVSRTSTSSSSRTSLSSKNVKRESRDSDVERLQEPVKRKHRDRRRTPEFSSSDEGEEDEPPAKRKATGPLRSASTNNRPSTSVNVEPKSISSSKGSSVNKPGPSRSYLMPSDKEGVRREYQRRHPQYLSLKAKLLAQYAKVEELFNNLKETDSVSDTDLLEQEELDRLVSEYKGLEKHLEQLAAVHTKLNAAY